MSSTHQSLLTTLETENQEMGAPLSDTKVHFTGINIVITKSVVEVLRAPTQLCARWSLPAQN